ncbi:hypothetical protein [Novosphingobium decolorationis]|uniref:Peptidase C-terminal archaeal/bacterial domain-containing protein n=1 Tax=Novosphingobium decolorationis TaxID=2698673 RepID=A0ABX8E1B7_9SPHN|nr:hypothetical protein [Novosphingobium decolorationis]QVM82929.1 hypothetical protein HT578_03710 [Novosphingobium decolorationis]
MTAAVKVPEAQYIEDGVTLSFPSQFRYLDPVDLEVARIEDGVKTVLNFETQWTASDGNSADGGTITLASSVAGQTLRIRRATPIRQQTDYVDGGRFEAESHELALDRLTLIAQDTRMLVDDIFFRGILAGEGEPGVPLPNAQDRAGKGWFFDENGDNSFISPDDFAAPAAAAAAAAADAALEAQGSAASAAAVGKFYDTIAEGLAAQPNDGDTWTTIDPAVKLRSSVGVLTGELNTQRYLRAIITDSTAVPDGYRHLGPVADPVIRQEVELRSTLEQLEIVRRQRPILSGFKSLLDGVVPANSLPPEITFHKLRDDYDEWAATNAMTPDGLQRSRWYFNRRNVGGTTTGAPGLLWMSRVDLLDEKVDVVAASNWGAEPISEGQAPIATKATGDADSHAGTWTASSTVNGMVDVRYSSVSGDKATYTVSGAERIVWRAYHQGSNSGVSRVTVKEAGVEIAEALYDLPSDHLVRNYIFNTGPIYVPVASGLNSTSTYTVEIEVDASNPAGGRTYDGGLRLYDDIAFDAVGRHGISTDQILGGVTSQKMTFAGVAVVYAFSDVTEIIWNFVQDPSAGVALFKVYDSAGIEISDYASSSRDCSGPAALGSAIVASGLARGDYYLRVKVGKTTNGNDHRIYDFGASGYDAQTPGDVDVDGFYYRGMSTTYSGYASAGNSILFGGGGNIEFAKQVRAASVSEAEFALQPDHYYVTGAHEYDSNPVDLVVKVDGDEVDYAGATAPFQWTAQERVEVAFSIFYAAVLPGVDLPADAAERDAYIKANPVGRLDWSMIFTAAGYYCGVVDTVLAAEGIFDYRNNAMMMMGPTSDPGTAFGDYELSRDVGGAFQTMLVDGYGKIASGVPDGVGIPIAPSSPTSVFCNDEYAVVGHWLNRDEVLSSLAALDPAAQLGEYGLYVRRADGLRKLYSLTGMAGNGYFRPQGHALETRKIYRAYHGQAALAAIGAA